MMKFMMIIGLLAIAYIIFTIVIIMLKNNNLENATEDTNTNITIYRKKSIMTEYEYEFYNKIKELESNYKVIPQLNLASIIQKMNNTKYYNDLFRNIDFAIFSYDYSKVLLLIEINDSTHNDSRRKKRDLKVKKICNDISVPLMTFYTNCSNEKEYVINRITKELEKNNTL